MVPTRLAIVTYNIWNTERWPQRQAALRGFFHRFRPDIFCLQELSPETRASLDEALPDYRRVEDPFPGWAREGNIYWNANLLDKVEHGHDDIGIRSNPYRALFWARLKVMETGETLFVSTAHYTYQEHPDEIRTGQSPRVEQVQRTIESLRQRVREGEPAFFMGDLNDPVIPNYLMAEAGYQSCFTRLELVPPTTWPAMPTARTAPMNRITTQTIDWIYSNDRARPLIAAAPQYYLEDIAPSDHWPVLAVYELE